MRKHHEKTSPRKLILTGDWTRAHCMTGTHATAWPTAVDTNVIQSRDLERGRVLCSMQKVERGKSTHPSFTEFGHHCSTPSRWPVTCRNMSSGVTCCWYLMSYSGLSLGSQSTPCWRFSATSASCQMSSPLLLFFPELTSRVPISPGPVNSIQSLVNHYLTS